MASSISLIRLVAPNTTILEGEPEAFVDVRPSQRVMNLEKQLAMCTAPRGVSNILSFHHATSFVLATPAGAQDSVDLVDKDDCRLQLVRQREYSADQLIRIAVPLLCEGRDMQVDKRCPTLMSDGLGQHRLPAAWWPVKQHPRGRRQQGPAMRIQVRHCEWVDDGFFELFDNVLEAADIGKADWYVFRCDDLEGYLVFILVEDQGIDL